MKKIVFLVCILSCLYTNAQSLKNKQILVYTKNGKGYVHDNIPNAVKCFDSLSKIYGFRLIKSAESSIFNREILSKTDVVVFASSNNEVFDTDAQRLEFRHYMEAGGNFFGIHIATGTERSWTWFKQLLGGTFAWHPKFQKFDVIKTDASHPTVSTLPSTWTRNDECYFLKEMFPGVKTILAADLNTVKADSADQKKIEMNKGPYLRYYPTSWEHYFDGGHIMITTLGHNKDDYNAKDFSQYLVENMKYLVGTAKKKNYSRIHSKGRDDKASGL